MAGQSVDGRLVATADLIDWRRRSLARSAAQPLSTGHARTSETVIGDRPPTTPMSRLALRPLVY